MTLERDWHTVAAQIIHRAYPDSDLLPINPPKVGEAIAEFSVRAQDAGDTLFLFLCREANDEIDVEEYLHRLDRAQRDIEAMHDAFAGLFAHGRPHVPFPSDPSPATT